MTTIIILHYYQTLTLVLAFRAIFFSPSCKQRRVDIILHSLKIALRLSSMNFILSALCKPLINSKCTEPVPSIQEPWVLRSKADWSELWTNPLPHHSSAICSVWLDPLQVLTTSFRTFMSLLFESVLIPYAKTWMHMHTNSPYACKMCRWAKENEARGLALRQIINPGNS